MATAGAPPLEGSNDVELASVYGDAGRFSPALGANMRAAAYLLGRARADLWHFVFAPNPRTSTVGRVLGRVRRVPVLQTVASPPRHFEGVDRLLFGDIVVTQSRFTAEQIRSATSEPRPRLAVIPPPVGEIPSRSLEARRALREKLDIPPNAPVFTYPGDIEVSGGAESVAAAVEPLGHELPDVVVVFAYRPKTPRAHDVARALEARLPRRFVRFTDTLPDVLALVEESSAVLFPVADLWGKVDQPIVLLEAMKLGVPIVTLEAGPLAELGGVVHVPQGDTAALVGAALALAREPGRRSAVASAQRDYVVAEHAAPTAARRYEELYLELISERRRRSGASKQAPSAAGGPPGLDFP